MHACAHSLNSTDSTRPTPNVRTWAQTWNKTTENENFLNKKEIKQKFCSTFSSTRKEAPMVLIQWNDGMQKISYLLVLSPAVDNVAVGYFHHHATLIMNNTTGSSLDYAPVFCTFHVFYCIFFPILFCFIFSFFNFGAVLDRALVHATTGLNKGR